MSTRLEDQQADIIGWFASHNTEAIRFVVEAGQAIIAEREQLFAGGHPTVSLNERRQG